MTEVRHIARAGVFLFVHAAAHAADKGPTASVHDHVVAGQPAQVVHIGDLAQLAVAQGQQLAILDRNHQQGSVRQPAQARSHLRHLRQSLQPALEIDRHHLAGQNIGEPQLARRRTGAIPARRTPARSLGKVESVYQNSWRKCNRHNSKTS